MNVMASTEPLNDAMSTAWPSWLRNRALGIGWPSLSSSKPDAAGADPDGGVSSGASPTFLTSFKYASLLTTINVALMRSPGSSGSSSLASRTLYGMVIAIMNPAISSCLMLASMWSAATDRIWPCKVYSRWSDPPAQALVRTASSKIRMDGRIDIVYSRTP